MKYCFDHFGFSQQPASAPAGPGQYAPPPPQMMMLAQPQQQMQQQHQQQQPQLQQQPGVPQPAVAELISFD